jgi:hypothetical protein
MKKSTQKFDCGLVDLRHASSMIETVVSIRPLDLKLAHHLNAHHLNAHHLNAHHLNAHHLNSHEI